MERQTDRQTETDRQRREGGRKQLNTSFKEEMFALVHWYMHTSSLCLSVCLSLSLCLCLSVCLSVCLSLSLSLFPPFWLSVCPPPPSTSLSHLSPLRLALIWALTKSDTGHVVRNSSKADEVPWTKAKNLMDQTQRSDKEALMDSKWRLGMATASAILLMLSTAEVTALCMKVLYSQQK